MGLHIMKIMMMMSHHRQILNLIYETPMFVSEGTPSMQWFDCLVYIHHWLYYDRCGIIIWHDQDKASRNNICRNYMYVCMYACIALLVLYMFLDGHSSLWNCVEKPTQPNFRFKLALKPERVPSSVTRLFLTFSIITG